MQTKQTLACAILFFVCAGYGSPPPHLTTIAAEALARQAIEGQGQHATELPGFHLEFMKKSIDASFYFFEATWSNPGPGSVVIGHFAVDPLTGDVWDGIVCTELQSAGLKRLQKKVRAEMGLTDNKYRKLRRPGPMC